MTTNGLPTAVSPCSRVANPPRWSPRLLFPPSFKEGFRPFHSDLAPMRSDRWLGNEPWAWSSEGALRRHLPSVPRLAACPAGEFLTGTPGWCGGRGRRGCRSRSKRERRPYPLAWLSGVAVDPPLKPSPAQLAVAAPELKVFPSFPSFLPPAYLLSQHVTVWPQCREVERSTRSASASRPA